MDEDAEIFVEGDEPGLIGEDENPFDNVVTFGRKSHGEVVPYVPPEETPRDKIAARERDDDAADLLQMIKERIDSGELHGICLVAGQFDEKGSLIDVVTIVSDTAASYPLAFLGAVEDMKQTLIEMRTLSDGEGRAPHDMELFELYDEI